MNWASDLNHRIKPVACTPVHTPGNDNNVREEFEYRLLVHSLQETSCRTAVVIPQTGTPYKLRQVDPSPVASP